MRDMYTFLIYKEGYFLERLFIRPGDIVIVTCIVYVFNMRVFCTLNNSMSDVAMAYCRLLLFAEKGSVLFVAYYSCLNSLLYIIINGVLQLLN